MQSTINSNLCLYKLYNLSPMEGFINTAGLKVSSNYTPLYFKK
jgi:hypothetical protein